MVGTCRLFAKGWVIIDFIPTPSNQGLDSTSTRYTFKIRFPREVEGENSPGIIRDLRETA